jgi:hypothetical protein
MTTQIIKKVGLIVGRAIDHTVILEASKEQDYSMRECCILMLVRNIRIETVARIRCYKREQPQSSAILI